MDEIIKIFENIGAMNVGILISSPLNTKPPGGTIKFKYKNKYGTAVYSHSLNVISVFIKKDGFCLFVNDDLKNLLPYRINQLFSYKLKI